MKPIRTDMEDLRMANQPKPRGNGTTRPGVAERAYAIWESEGKPEGHDMEHWLRAEAEAAASAKPKRKPAAKPRKPSAKAAPKAAARIA